MGCVGLSLLSGGCSFARVVGLQPGHKTLQENEVKFCTRGAEFLGGPVESAPAWRGWARVAFPDAPGEWPWLHPLLLSKGWWVRPAFHSSETSF